VGPSLNHLVVLEALLRTRSPTAAARELTVTQSAVSKTLAALRRELGDPLLLRRGDGMVLTPRAERLAGPLAAQLRSLRGLIADSPADPGPAVVVIAMRDQFVVSLGAALLRAVASGSSQTEVRFVSYDRDRIGDELARGAVDVAVAVDPPDRPGLRQTVLYQERFVCVAPARRRLTLRSYLAEDHVVATAHAGYTGIDTALAKMGYQRRIVAYTTYFAAALHLADELGILATLPSRVASSLPLRRLKVYPLPVTLPGFTCRMVWDARVDADVRNRWVRDAILASAGRRAQAQPKALGQRSPGERTTEK
jgi:DNA-binding transcriptional LysR family regulator